MGLQTMSGENLYSTVNRYADFPRNFEVGESLKVQTTKRKGLPWRLSILIQK